MKSTSEEGYKHTRVGSVHLISIEWVTDNDILSHPIYGWLLLLLLDIDVRSRYIYMRAWQRTNRATQDPACKWLRIGMKCARSDASGSIGLYH